jgi:hypothetical protein
VFSFFSFAPLSRSTPQNCGAPVTRRHPDPLPAGLCLFPLPVWFPLPASSLPSPSPLILKPGLGFLLYPSFVSSHSLPSLACPRHPQAASTFARVPRKSSRMRCWGTFFARPEAGRRLLEIRVRVLRAATRWSLALGGDFCPGQSTRAAPHQVGQVRRSLFLLLLSSFASHFPPHRASRILAGTGTLSQSSSQAIAGTPTPGGTCRSQSPSEGGATFLPVTWRRTHHTSSTPPARPISRSPELRGRRFWRPLNRNVPGGYMSGRARRGMSRTRTCQRSIRHQPLLEA